MNTQLHLKLHQLVAEYYDGSKEPFIVIATCSDGCRYEVDKGHVMQCRIAKWGVEYYRYTENGLGYVRATWTGLPINIIVNDDKRL